MPVHRQHSCSAYPFVCPNRRLQIVMSCISTNRIGDKVHVDCLVKRITGCRARLHIPRVFPGIACSVAIPKVANAESVKSRMKMTCCSKYGQLIDREFMGEFAIRLPGLKGVGCRRAVDSLGRCASRDDGPACRDSLPRAKAQDGVRIARVGQRCVDTADRKTFWRADVMPALTVVVMSVLRAAMSMA